jgi:hypothetical protein
MAVGPRLSRNPFAAAAMRVSMLVAQPDTDGALPQLYAATMPDVGPDEYFGPDGPMEFRGSPTRVERSRPASDLAAGARLWRRSEELTGVTYPWP